MADKEAIEQALVLGSTNTSRIEFETKDKSLSRQNKDKSLSWKLAFWVIGELSRFSGCSVETASGAWLLNCLRVTDGCIVDTVVTSIGDPPNFFRVVQELFYLWERIFMSSETFRFRSVFIYVAFKLSGFFSVSQVFVAFCIETIDILFVPLE